MGFNFPNAPAVNDSFTPAGGPTFVWDGIAWKGLVQGVPVTVSTGDTPPVSPALGQLWWESDTGNMFIWYSDPDSAQWVQVSGAVSARPTAETRNRIVNGAMQISQENGNTAGTTNGFYIVDQWEMTFTTTGTFTAQRVQVWTPRGDVNRLRVTVTAADTSIAATDWFLLRQKIEGIRVADFQYSTAMARQCVLRFGFKAPAGTYSLMLQNGASNRTYLANFTVTAGQANTDTEQTIVIPGDTTGTWLADTGIGLQLAICLVTGTTYQGVAGWQAGLFFGTASTSNGLGTAGNVFELFDVGLYLDPLASGVAPAWTMPDEAQELAACMRYWQKTGALFAGTVTSGMNYYSSIPRPNMRTSPPATSGVNVAASLFPATVGTFEDRGVWSDEYRTANATGGNGFFMTTITFNSRM